MAKKVKIIHICKHKFNAKSLFMKKKNVIMKDVISLLDSS